MKTFSLILYTIFLCSLASGPVTEDKFTEIRSICKMIDEDVKANRLTRKSIDSPSYLIYNTTAYFSGDEIKYMHGEYKSDESFSLTDLYFEERKLIFIKNADHSNIEKILQSEEFYFENNKMIRWKDKSGKFVLKTDSAYIKNENHLVKSIGILVNEFKSKK
jgi:hypothetical protein